MLARLAHRTTTIKILVDLCKQKKPQDFLAGISSPSGTYDALNHDCPYTPQADNASMVMAGTKHFKANLLQLDNQDTASTIYRVLRLYDPGDIEESNLSDAKGARLEYVSDIANRLWG